MIIKTVNRDVKIYFIGLKKKLAWAVFLDIEKIVTKTMKQV